MAGRIIIVIGVISIEMQTRQNRPISSVEEGGRSAMPRRLFMDNSFVLQKIKPRPLPPAGRVRAGGEKEREAPAKNADGGENEARKRRDTSFLPSSSSSAKLG